MSEELSVHKQAYIYIHNSHTLASEHSGHSSGTVSLMGSLCAEWELLEIGVAKSKRTFLIENGILKNPEFGEVKNLLPGESPLRHALCVPSCQFSVYHVVKLCAPLVALQISPYRITDLYLKVTRYFPHLRDLELFDLAEQLLGIYLPERQFDSSVGKYGFQLSRLRYMGLCSEILYHLSRYLDFGNYPSPRSSRPRLQMVKAA